MKTPTPRTLWQAFAQGGSGVLNAFAMTLRAHHCFCAGRRQLPYGLRNHCCYPSPSLRSGPSQAGPTLSRRAGADCVSRIRNCFESRVISVESAAITTNQRGSIPCASRLSFSPFFQCHWLAACRTRHRAALLAQRPVRSSPMPPRVTSSPAPSLAVLRVPQAAGSTSGFRPAVRPTDLTAFGRTTTTATPTARTIRADRPGGPLHFRV